MVIPLTVTLIFKDPVVERNMGGGTAGPPGLDWKRHTSLLLTSHQPALNGRAHWTQRTWEEWRMDQRNQLAVSAAVAHVRQSLDDKINLIFAKYLEQCLAPG